MQLAARTGVWSGGESKKPLFVFPSSLKRVSGPPTTIMYFSLGEAILSMASNGYSYNIANENALFENGRIRFYPTSGSLTNWHCVAVPQILEKNCDYKLSCVSSATPQRVFISGYVKSGSGFIWSATIKEGELTVKSFNSGNYDLLIFGFGKSIDGDGSIEYSDIVLEKTT